MDWLNYHHLRYFWSVAREGSLRRAAETLGISQPSISAQVRQLEEALGEKLFRRSGRGLALTDAGVTNEALDIYRRGIEVARRRGDQQAQKEMSVFARRLEKKLSS